ncbi:ATP-binding protein [Paenibacillus sp. FSL L8-0470]|uniref:ATP-binding protein n=1 Tax=unclassified Paenibacillus TaxID=185978 RepID=UPI0030F93AF1
MMTLYYFIVILLLLILIMWETLLLFGKFNRNTKLIEENLLLQKQLDYQHSSYEQTVHSITNIKQVIHDTNKQLVYVRTCIQNNEIQESIHHINQMLGQIHQPAPKLSTGNLAIDALIDNALNIACEHCIAMNNDIRIHTGAIEIERLDLCTVIGNVLDNALEAAARVPKKEDRFIHLLIFTTDTALFIQVTNSRSESSAMVRCNRKTNAGFHGFGLTNIQRVAKKYGGNLVTKAQNYEFETIIVLPFSNGGIVRSPGFPCKHK